MTVFIAVASIDRGAVELDASRLAFDISLAANPVHVEGAANHREAIDRNVAAVVELGATVEDAKDFVALWVDESDPNIPARFVAQCNAEWFLSPTRWNGWHDEPTD